MLGDKKHLNELGVKAFAKNLKDCILEDQAELIARKDPEVHQEEENSLPKDFLLENLIFQVHLVKFFLAIKTVKPFFF